ncbi:CRTAC1 family protein [bacterium]|nr:CRTAC1 family protein [bacterium]
MRVAGGFSALCLSILYIGLPGASDASQFRLVNEELGIVDHHMGMSVTWGDYDGNGYPEFFINGYRRHPEILYRNLGPDGFRRADTEAGVFGWKDRNRAPESGFGSGWADYDNDGDLDLLVVNTDGQVSFLYRSDGPNESGMMTFKDVAAASGFGAPSNAVGCAWADYDGDGYLDVFLSNGAGLPDLLYRNLGNGTFQNVSKRAGIADTASGAGVAWGDYDNDGDLDLFVNNSSTHPKFLYRNNGNGTFTDVAFEAGVAQPSDGQGCAWSDHDNDGDLDLYVSNYGGAQDFFYRNNGDGMFTQTAEKVGLKSSAKSRGAAWGDIDNDGDFDLLVGVDWGMADMLFVNYDGGKFVDLGVPLGMVGGWTISTSFADYDMDGRMDIYVSTQVSHVDLIYHNEDTRGLNWIKVNPLTAGPRDLPKEQKTDPPMRLAIGAWVEVDMDGGADFAKGPGRYAAQIVGAGDGYASNALPVHFGVRRAKTVDVRVRYPTGQVITQKNIPVNQVLVVKDR